MGFDSRVLKVYQRLLNNPHFDLHLPHLSESPVHSTEPDWSNCLNDQENPFLGFRPHPGWEGHVEIKAESTRELAYAN
jgi:hypothetical protein